MDILKLSGCELVGLASILSIYISQGLNTDEIEILGNFFSALGENLSTISSANANNCIN